MSRDEVLEHRHAFLEVGEDRVLDDVVVRRTGFLWLSHKTTHTCELGNLVSRTTGSRVEHHEDGIEALVGLCHLLHESLLDRLVHLRPCFHHLLVAVLVGDETHLVVHRDLFHIVVAFLHDLLLLLWDDDVIKHEGESTLIRLAVTQVLDAVEEFASACHTNALDDASDDFLECFLANDLIDEAYLLWHNIVDDDTAYSSLHEVADRIAFMVNILHDTLDEGMHVHLTFVVGDDGLFRTVECESFALCSRTNL